MPPLHDNNSSSVVSAPPADDRDTTKVQKWLDQNQYSKNGILRYEKIFGRTYVSTGGEQTTKQMVEKLGLQNGQKVLDICCGTGGSAFFMARKYSVEVHGVDLSTNMLGIAQDYRMEMEAEVKHRVQFHEEDVTKMEYPENFYDAVYSRDGIMHIPDKVSLYKQFYKTLKPGGKVLVTDYCCGEGELTQKFKDYMADRGYYLVPVKRYGEILKEAGFKDVQAIDTTDIMVQVLHRELEDFHKIEKEFVAEFSQQDFDWIVKGWKIKVDRCGEGEQLWGMVMGTK